MVIEDKLMGKDLKAEIGKRRKKQSINIENPIEEMNLPDEAARESRGHWKHPLDFLFSCISVSVGLGSKYTCFLESRKARVVLGFFRENCKEVRMLTYLVL